MQNTGITSFLNAMSAQGLYPYKDGRLNIVGWRYYPANVNQFNDIISVYWSENGMWVGSSWAATTYPGLPWLKKPMSSQGTAILVPGQYESAYAIGLHKGYEALVQVKPVLVYRDKNKDSAFNEFPDTIQSGIFGINIHKAGLWSKLVGQNSAGCQVFQKASDFEKFMALCRATVSKFGNTFTYTLLEYV